jgi:hypothetical protein
MKGTETEDITCDFALVLQVLSQFSDEEEIIVKGIYN